MDKIKQLQQLKEMLDAQLISQEEYDKLKAELLNVNLNKIEVENQVNSTFNQVEQEKIEVPENKEETPKSVEGSSVNEIEKEDFYTKEKPQFSKKGLLWFFLVVAVIEVFYQLHDRNVFKLRDKISELYSDKIKIDINDKAALEDYIQGKWSWERHTGDPNGTWRYRFEIIGDKLRIWSCMNNVKDPFEMGEGYDEFVFSLGDATRDVDGYNARYLEFGVFDNDYSLTYFGLEPFWLVSDENWDKPVLRCSTGLPTWSRAEFTSTGKKLNTETSDSDSNTDYYSNQDGFTEESSAGFYDEANEQKEKRALNSSSVRGYFPQASERLLTKSELVVMSKPDLKLMRNEIFARHGYIFKSTDMIAHFSAQSWYKGHFEDVSSLLTTIEKKNIELIKSYE